MAFTEIRYYLSAGFSQLNYFYCLFSEKIVVNTSLDSCVFINPNIPELQEYQTRYTFKDKNMAIIDIRSSLFANTKFRTP